MKKAFMGLVVMCSLVLPSFGGNEGSTYKKSFEKEILSERTTTEVEEKVFRAHEWQGDVFGFFADTSHDSPQYRDGFGGGAGLNYFWDEHWGAGLEAYWWEGSHVNNRDRVLHNVGANLFYRYPIQDWKLAPYVFIGPGGHFNGEGEASGHGGGGFEWRFLENIGLFADARYNFTTGPDDFALYRTGIRFNF
jgi:outer membrane protein with beta-barrel domain